MMGEASVGLLRQEVLRKLIGRKPNHSGAAEAMTRQSMLAIRILLLGRRLQFKQPEILQIIGVQSPKTMCTVPMWVTRPPSLIGVPGPAAPFRALRSASRRAAGGRCD